MVGGIVKLDKALKSTEELTDKRKEFSEAYGGAMKAGGVLALDSTMDFKQLEIPTEILKFLNGYTFSTAQVAKSFGLPLEKLGIETTNTSQSQANADYLKSTLYPIFSCFSTEIEFKMIDYPLINLLKLVLTWTGSLKWIRKQKRKWLKNWCKELS